MGKATLTKPIAEQVRRRIEKVKPGTIFLVQDFLDLGSQQTITRTLSRLTEEGALRRLRRGVYDVPRISTLLGKPVPPDPALVAAALARRVGGEIIPSPAQAANLLGLTTQVPAKNVYQTNSGKTRRVQVGNQTIELRRVSARHFPGSKTTLSQNALRSRTNSIVYEKTDAILQGLQFVGEGNITPGIIAKVRGELSEHQRTALSKRLSDAPAWMHPALRQISRHDADQPA